LISLSVLFFSFLPFYSFPEKKRMGGEDAEEKKNKIKTNDKK